MEDDFGGLDVPADIRSFFNIDTGIFYYGDDCEEFSGDRHRVPTTTNIWTAGNIAATEVIICSSAMEAVAFFCLNRHKYARPFDLFFVALGNLPHPVQLELLRLQYNKRKFTVVFGNDLLGRLADVRVATGLRKKMVGLSFTGQQLRLSYKTKVVTLDTDKLSLSAAEKMLGIRTGIRTSKPVQNVTFLEELRNKRCTQKRPYFKSKNK